MATSVLRRIVRPAMVPEPDSVLAARALRLAMTRAAQNHADLPLSVLGIGEQVAMLDEVLQGIGADMMLVGIAPRAARGGSALAEPARPAGFVAIDSQTRAALIEAQMLGRVLSTVADPRPPTAADLAMAEPLVTGFLAELAITTEDTPLAGWTAGQDMQGRIADAREAGLRLAYGRYRVVRLTLDLGAGGRQGLVMIALPLPEVVQPPDTAREAFGWAPRLAANVLAARSEVTAVLHKMSLPLTRVEGFAVDQLLVLDGISVASVRIEALDGRTLGTGRLGQIGGMRAVRIEPPPLHSLTDAPLVPPRPRDATAHALPVPPGPGHPPRQAKMPKPAASPQDKTGDRAQEHHIAPDTPPADPAVPPRDAPRTMPAKGGGGAAMPRTATTGGAPLATGDMPDLRPDDDLPIPATIAPIRADMPTGIAISNDVAARGGLDLADEIDLDRPS